LKPGRGARYPARNADRALAVRALQDLHGLSLSEIGRRFLMATEDQIRAWALEAGATSARVGSAREYLRRIQARIAGTQSARRSMDVFASSTAARAPEPSSFDPRFGKPSLEAS
jgi:hypothetical protein